MYYMNFANMCIHVHILRIHVFIKCYTYSMKGNSVHKSKRFLVFLETHIYKRLQNNT